MKQFRADLHIHTVLSPCGDLDNSPIRIVNRAREKGLDIIGITDHNSTLHAPLIRKLAEPHGIYVMMGAEVTTKEEAHCLAFFETEKQLAEFQQYLDEHHPFFANDPDQFGYQLQVDENEEIIQMIDYLLITALDQSIDEIAAKVHQLEGLFIPAHIDKQRFSVISQLGFIPPGLQADAFEISPRGKADQMQAYIKKHPVQTFIQSSDAHLLDDIGKTYCIFEMPHHNWQEIKRALKGEEGRKVVLVG